MLSNFIGGIPDLSGFRIIILNNLNLLNLQITAVLNIRLVNPLDHLLDIALQIKLDTGIILIRRQTLHNPNTAFRGNAKFY